MILWFCDKLFVIIDDFIMKNFYAIVHIRSNLSGQYRTWYVCVLKKCRTKSKALLYIWNKEIKLLFIAFLTTFNFLFFLGSIFAF